MDPVFEINLPQHGILDFSCISALTPSAALQLLCTILQSCAAIAEAWVQAKAHQSY